MATFSQVIWHYMKLWMRPIGWFKHYMTQCNIKLTYQSHCVFLNIPILALQTCMIKQANIDRLARKIISVKKTASKWPKVLDNFWDIITLEGAGRQIIDTRSISGEPLKSFGHNHSNELCGRSVASKLTTHKPNEFFFVDGQQNWPICIKTIAENIQLNAIFLGFYLF